MEDHSAASHGGPGIGPAKGRLVLRGIRAFGYHGFYDFERKQGQFFVVDVACTLNLDAAAATDDLTKTVDYGALAKAVAADIQGPPLNLVEALAERIAGTCLRSPLVEVVEVTVHKPQAPMPVEVADVAVSLTRTRSHPAPANRGGES
jgi:7,8-dihydroneopterin aldolase/epimerase/oxygenase